MSSRLSAGPFKSASKQAGNNREVTNRRIHLRGLCYLLFQSGEQEQTEITESANGTAAGTSGGTFINIIRGCSLGYIGRLFG